ncbi:MAG: hypothetical protein QXL14_00610 [Candidatus Aenigmatarchaeota archaeon]
MVRYPEGPPPLGKDLKPGEGINSNPLDQDITLDYTSQLGGCTGAYYGISFQLGKWGFERAKINESIFVSPINKGYYELVLKEKEQLMQQIKVGLQSIAEAYSDLELLLHDLRKYRRYVEYFEKIKEIEKKIQNEKNEEMKKKLVNEKISIEQTLRAVFIDEVDIHTDLPNTPISLRSISSRWPTIISDFMKLGEEKSPEEIKLDVSYAEKVVLATKNKLFLEWKKMFLETVVERYRRLKELAEARKRSIEEYKNSLRPIIARYKMINDALSSSGGRAAILRSFFRPDAQAFSIDSMTLWAWKAIAPAEKWKASYERIAKILPEEAGFTQQEIEELIKKGIIKPGDKIDSLPVEPSIDNVVRKIKREIEKEYKIKLTASDLFEARKRLLSRYSAGAAVGTEGVLWPFSPYFVFVELPLERAVLFLPNGAQIEDLMIRLRTYVKTQNIIIGHILELIAREKRFEYEIGALFGEFGLSKDRWESVENMLKEEFGEIYGEYKEIKEDEQKKEKNLLDQILGFFSKISEYFGINLTFIRARGPYEFIVSDRITKYYLKQAGVLFSEIRNYFNLVFNVPGARGVSLV